MQDVTVNLRLRLAHLRHLVDVGVDIVGDNSRLTLLNQELTRIFPSSLLNENYYKICTIISLTVKVVRSIDIQGVLEV
jgi:hypothetical protein